MDVKTAAEYIGKVVTVRMESLAVAVRVVNAKNAYGCWRILVEPVSGSGQQWVDVARVCGKPVENSNKPLDNGSL